MAIGDSPRCAATAVVVYAVILAVASRAQEIRAFRGTIATPSGFLDDATLVVEKNGTIRSVGKNAILSPGTTVIDVGAGTGVFSMMLSDAVGPTGRVYAEEVLGKFSVYIADLAAISTAPTS